MPKVAIIGTVGVPANYGGFETLVENIIGENCSCEVEYTVFCSSKDCVGEQRESFRGAKLEYVPLKANGVQSIPYDILSLMKVLRGFDAILILGVSGCIALPFFRLLSRSKIIVNIDGLEWKRNKWGRFAKCFLRLSEWMAVKTAHVVVADNQGIVDHVKDSYGQKAELIAYGGDHVICNISEIEQQRILQKYKLSANDYSFKVCRIEPENNCEMILRTFSQSDKDLIFVGNWNKCEYGRRLKEQYSKFENISIQDPIYDLETLYALRNNCRNYVHGHSAGGTNPSLVEAMYCKCNIIAYDVIYNRATTENKAKYFQDETSLLDIINAKGDNSHEMRTIAEQRYRWSTIAEQYESLY